MYRPTVRYSDAYRDHINNLFRETTLDRNQILRLALHVAAHSDQFNQILSKYKRGDVPLSSPVWKLDSPGLWMDNTLEETKGGKYVNGIQQEEEVKETRVVESTSTIGDKEQHRRKPETQGRKREIPSEPIRRVTNQGGITIKIG
jgi:hypothetical protein